MGYPAEATVDSPYMYLPLQERDTQNPVNYGSGGGSPSLNSTYTWGVSGPDGRRALLLRSGSPSGSITVPRFTLTANQTRLAWVRTTNLDSTNDYAGDAAMTVCGDASGSVWDSFGIHNGKVRFTRFNNSAWQTFDSAKTVADGRWHHIGVTYDSSTRAVTLYVDGIADGSGTMTAHQAQGGVNRVGRGFTNDFFDGALAEVELFQSVLPAARILARYRVGCRGSVRRPSGLLVPA